MAVMAEYDDIRIILLKNVVIAIVMDLQPRAPAAYLTLPTGPV